MIKGLSLITLALPIAVYAATPLVTITPVKSLPAHSFVTESYEVSYALHNNSGQEITVSIAGAGITPFSKPCKLAPAGESGSECIIRAAVKINRAGDYSVMPELNYLSTTVELVTQSTRANVAPVSLYAGGMNGFSYSTNGGMTWKTRTPQEIGLNTPYSESSDLIQANDGDIVAATPGGLGHYNGTEWQTQFPVDSFTDIEKGGNSALAVSSVAFFVSQDGGSHFTRHLFNVPGFNRQARFLGQLAAVSTTGKTMAYEMYDYVTQSDVLAISHDGGSNFTFVKTADLSEFGRINYLHVTDKAIYFVANSREEVVKGTFAAGDSITWQKATLKDLGYPTANPETDGIPTIQGLQILGDNMEAISVANASVNRQEGGILLLNASLGKISSEAQYGKVYGLSAIKQGTGYVLAGDADKFIGGGVDNRGILSFQVDANGAIEQDSVQLATRTDLGLNVDQDEWTSTPYLVDTQDGTAGIVMRGGLGTLVYGHYEDGKFHYDHLRGSGLASLNAVTQPVGDVLWASTSSGVSRIDFSEEGTPRIESFNADTPNFPRYDDIDQLDLSPDGNTLVAAAILSFSVGSVNNLANFISHSLPSNYDADTIVQDGLGDIYVANFDNIQYSSNNGQTFQAMDLDQPDPYPIKFSIHAISLDKVGNLAINGYYGIWVKNKGQGAVKVGFPYFRDSGGPIRGAPWSIARNGSQIATTYRDNEEIRTNSALAFVTQNADGTIEPTAQIYSSKNLGFDSTWFGHTSYASNGVNLTGVSPDFTDATGGFVVRNSEGMVPMRPADVGITAKSSGAVQVAIKDFPASHQCVALLEFESSAEGVASPFSVAIGKSSNDCEDNPHDWNWTVANEKTIGFSVSPQNDESFNTFPGQSDELEILSPNAYFIPTQGGLSVTYDGGHGFATYNAKTPGFAPSNAVHSSAAKFNTGK